MTRGSSSSHCRMSSLEPSRGKLLWRVKQINGLSRKISTLSIICACVRAFDEQPCLRLHVYFSTYRDTSVDSQQKCWISVSCASFSGPAWHTEAAMPCPITTLLSPRPVGRKLDIVKAGRDLPLGRVRLNQGNSFSRRQFLDLSSRKIWASYFAQVFILFFSQGDLLAHETEKTGCTTTSQSHQLDRIPAHSSSVSESSSHVGAPYEYNHLKVMFRGDVSVKALDWNHKKFGDFQTAAPWNPSSFTRTCTRFDGWHTNERPWKTQFVWIHCNKEWYTHRDKDNGQVIQWTKKTKENSNCLT